MNGVAEPLEQLPTMHAVLDVVEAMAVEGKANEGGDAVQRFYFELYRPDEHEVRKAIETADTDAEFDAFAAQGLH